MIVVRVLLFGAAMVAPFTSVAQTAPEAQSVELARQLLEELGTAAFASRSPIDEEAIRRALRADIESMHFEDDPLGREPARSIFGTNPLTGDRNPLLNEADRQRWLAQAIDDLGIEMVSAHLKEQAAALRSGEVDRQAWYTHVAACTKLCNPVVQGLLVEHVRQVAARPHLLATFATDSAELTPSAARQVEAFVRQQREAADDTRILLIGRASRTGARVYNRELSARRVQSLRRYVSDLGVAGESVTGFWLGYEPPQISDEIAVAYGLSELLDELSRNQSVLLVAYRQQ